MALKSRVFKTKTALANELGYKLPTIKEILDAYEIRINENVGHEVSTAVIADTRALCPEERKKIISRVQEEEIQARDVQSFVSAIKGLERCEKKNHKQNFSVKISVRPLRDTFETSTKDFKNFVLELI